MRKILNFFKKLFKSNEPQPEFKPYVEKDTRCDKCPGLNECMEKGYLVESTRLDDSRRHYIPAPCVFCAEYWEVENEKTESTK